MEGHPVMEREHTRVHEENKTEASKVWWVRWVWSDEDRDGQMKMGTNPDRYLRIFILFILLSLYSPSGRTLCRTLHTLVEAFS